MVKSEPSAIYGRRRPQRDLHESDSTPTFHNCVSSRYAVVESNVRGVPIMGCTSRPDIGPAAKTRAMCDLDTPRESRYGGAAILKLALQFKVVLERASAP